MNISPEQDNRLHAIDLRGLPDDKMQALRQAAIRKGVTLPRLLADLVDDASARLIAGPAACDPDGRGARAAGMDHADAA